MQHREARLKAAFSFLVMTVYLGSCVTPSQSPPNPGADQQKGLAAMNIINIMTGDSARIPETKIFLKYNGVMFSEVAEPDPAQENGGATSTCESSALLAIYKSKRVIGEIELTDGKRFFIDDDQLYQITVKEAGNERTVLFVEIVQDLPNEAEVVSEH